ncbi:hypothetical protein [Citricoccus sp. K5]|uniref:hypothetical protein n=1 Tax=Citricoccus sp. K5 TaxID=2653135 RepID=UPI0012EF56DA|nr:hypothetical protein [Citricoccus sp. K5]VXB41848.1 hypothetical protein CITRIK5_30491 [Citricoccus sp. K5]
MKLRTVLLFSAGITILTVAVGLGVGLLLADHLPWMVVTAFVCTMLLVPVHESCHLPLAPDRGALTSPLAGHPAWGFFSGCLLGFPPD